MTPRHLSAFSSLRLGLFTCLSVCLLLCGCGASPAVSGGGTGTSSANPAAGSWLVQGAQPTYSPLADTFGLDGIEVNFDISGSQITGTADVSVGGCIYPGYDFAIQLGTTTIDSSGNFTLDGLGATEFSLSSNFEIIGTITTGSQPTLTGSYYFYTNSSCNYTTTGNFTGRKVSSISGTYDATVQMFNSGATTGTPTTVSMTLQQGSGTATSGSGTVTGTISVTGSSCFTSGTVYTSTGYYSVYGDEFELIFDMNDGSNLALLGNIANSGATSLTSNLFVTQNSKCDVVPYQYSVFVKQ